MSEQFAYMVVREVHDYYGSFDVLAFFLDEGDAKTWCKDMRRLAGEPLWDDPDDYDLHYRVRKVRLGPAALCDRQGRFPEDSGYTPWPKIERVKR